MKTIGTQTIYDNVRFAKSIGTTNPQGTLNINSGDITLYDATDNGNPTISLGSSASERLEIKATYESGGRGLDAVEFITYTAGSSANDGRFIFKVDEVNTFQIKDSLVNIMESGKLTIGNVDILTDSSGTTTLNNIDALDATTISTINSAITAGDITSVGSGSGLTGGAVSGDVTLNVGAGDGITVNTNDVAITATQTTITSIYNAGLKVGRDADNLLDFATTDNKITFRANGADQIVLQDGALTPRTTNDIDLGSSSFEFKDAYFDGTVTSDAFAGPLTGNVTGDCSGTAATVTSNTQAAIETCANLGTVGTITTGVWRGTVIENLYTSASGKRYGNYIKILPSDFMINDDAASPLSFKDGSNSGVHVNDTASEAVAFITIPEGMKATHVDIYGTHNKTIKVWEVDVDSSFDFTSTTKGTGSMNTTLDITDVNATADNYLAIQVTLTATSQRIWGGKVTIAAQ